MPKFINYFSNESGTYTLYRKDGDVRLYYVQKGAEKKDISDRELWKDREFIVSLFKE